MTASASNSSQDKSPVGDESSLWGVIQSLEQIVEILPEDVSALESLAGAYEQAGDTARAHQTFLKLAELAIQGGDLERAEEIAATQLSKGFEEPELYELKDRISSAKSEQPSQPPQQQEQAETKPEPVAAHEKIGPEADLHAELDFGWSLLESEQVTQDQYEHAVDALTEAHINTHGRGPISFLLELASMEQVNVSRVLGFVSAENRVPFIEVRRCQISAEALADFNLDKIRRLCAIPFGVVGNERMIAVLNPTNERLMKALRTTAGGRIHIYLTSPEDFLETLDSLSA
ncbi:MAG: hypothetical protein ACOCUY_00345 [Verrucomicrobiota bacterium]